MCKFRKLNADELQCKCTDTKNGAATILIYKDARVDQKVLDETVTPMRWQKDYKDIDGKVYCGVAIKNEENGEWIWKWDCGTEGNFEAEKSEASDSFKRACFNWGLGRELYETPKIRIKCPDSYYRADKMIMSFRVKSIVWDGDTLVDLIIVDRNGNTVYDYKNGGTNLFNGQNNTGMRVPEAPTQFDNKERLIQFCKQTKTNGGIDEAQLTKFYKFYIEKCSEWTKYPVDWNKKWENWSQK